jgi:hypothetical protein
MNITDPIRKFAREQSGRIIRPNGVRFYRERIGAIDFTCRSHTRPRIRGATVGIRPRPWIRCRLARARLGAVPRQLPMKAVTLCLTDEPIPRDRREFLLERIWVEDLAPVSMCLRCRRPPTETRSTRSIRRRGRRDTKFVA